jgi:hypothetical protein
LQLWERMLQQAHRPGRRDQGSQVRLLQLIQVSQ